MQSILVQLAIEQVAVPIIGFLVAAFLGWAAQRFHAWTGYQIEAKHREALQSALENGVRYAVQQLLIARPGADPGQVAALERDAVLDAAEVYVRKSVPDALHHFGLDIATDRLRELVTTKLPMPLGLDVLLGQ